MPIGCGEHEPASHEVSHGAPPRPAPPARTLGFQRFTLGLNDLCERCNAILPKGGEAAIGVLDGPGPRPVVCLVCMEELTHVAP